MQLQFQKCRCKFENFERWKNTELELNRLLEENSNLQLDIQCWKYKYFQMVQNCENQLTNLKVLKSNIKLLKKSLKQQHQLNQQINRNLSNVQRELHQKSIVLHNNIQFQSKLLKMRFLTQQIILSKPQHFLSKYHNQSSININPNPQFNQLKIILRDIFYQCHKYLQFQNVTTKCSFQFQNNIKADLFCFNMNKYVIMNWINQYSEQDERRSIKYIQALEQFDFRGIVWLININTGKLVKEFKGSQLYLKSLNKLQIIKIKQRKEHQIKIVKND